MPNDMQVLETARGSVPVDARLHATTVTLSTGTATLTYTDIEGIENDPESEPYVFVTGPTGNEFVSSKGTTQCTINGNATDDVECLVALPEN